MDKIDLLLKDLTETPGISSFEDRIKERMRYYLSSLGEITCDKLGSILCEKRGESSYPRIMIAGHMDEIGFIVKYVTDEGFLKFAPIGSWWSQVLPSQRVMVYSKNGEFPGVVGSKPPHLMLPDEREKPVKLDDLFIDVGAKNREEAENDFGIKPGSPVVPWSPYQVMGKDGKFLMGKAWDDRIGCAVIIRVLEDLKGERHPNTVIGAGTVQEEVGLRGAETSVKVAKPDIAFVVESGIAGDTPNVKKDESDVKLGKGPTIGMMDSSMLPNRKLVEFVEETARELGIPYQYEFMLRGGEDGGRIHLYNSGVPTVTINVPARYIHSHTGVIHRDDFENTVKLLENLIKRLNAEKVLRFI
ncbi:MAG TPA: M42 family metallopeptidase [bacterium]|nr:M42 family metallopeptidase [bacterium]